LGNGFAGGPVLERSHQRLGGGFAARAQLRFLANRLAGEHVFQVVSDPKLADAVLTDRIGGALNSSLEDIFPTALPAAAEDKDAKKKTAGQNKPDQPGPTATFR